MVKVSVIIPIYNNEKYIKQCVESVLEQTLKDLEVICIDDGSMDDSAKIVKNIMSMEERVVLLQQANQGPGIARNLGIKKAKGKYVVFLDADDYYLDKDALEKMYNSCETCDVLVCACLNWCILDKIVRTEKLELLDKNQIKNEIFYYKDYQMDYNFINYLFLREFLLENDLFFPQYRRFEDPPFLVNVLYHSVCFAVVDACLYCYRAVDPEVRFNHKKTLDLLYGLIDNLIFAKENNLEVLFQNTIYRLEYEYRNIILKNIDLDDLEILKLLMQANQIICCQKGDPNYMIKPLRMILLYSAQYEKKLLERIRNENEIVLYGAGNYSRAFLGFLKKNHIFNKVVYIVVSDLKENELYIDDIPVITLKDLQRFGEKPVFVTVGEEVQPEIKKYLDKNNYRNYEMIKDEFLYAIANEMI